MLIKIFFCYARKDEDLLNKLKAHLKPLQRQGLIEFWHDRDISAGTRWKHEITKQLNSVRIILLLISSDFMNSDYCYGIEMKQALERHKRGEAKVIPIILRPAYWHGEPLGELQALPTDGKPVTDWQSLDAALYDVTLGIRKVVEQLTAHDIPVQPVISEGAVEQATAHDASGEPVVTAETQPQEAKKVSRVTSTVQQRGKGSPSISSPKIQNSKKASRVLQRSNTSNKRSVKVKSSLTPTKNLNRPPLLPIFFSILVVVALSIFGIIELPALVLNMTSTPNVTATQVAHQATATAIPMNLYNTVTQKTPSLNDPLKKNNDNSQWVENDACKFQDSAYHITASTVGQYIPCMAIKYYENFAYQVNMKVIKGNTGGLIFRSRHRLSTFYRFSLNIAGVPSIHVCNGNDKKPCTANHFVDEGTDLTPTSWLTLDPKIAGMTQTNTVTVIVQNTTIYIYVNGHFIGLANDASRVSGQIGLYAAATDQPTEIAFSNVKVWDLYNK